MKKKLLVFISIITFTMNFLLVAPKIKAQTNTRIIVESYNVETGSITFYYYDTLEYFGTFNTYNITIGNVPLILEKEHIPLVFRLGDVYEVIEDHTSYIVIEFIKPADRQIFFTLDDMVEYQAYEYKGIIDNMYIFQQGFNFYRVPMQGITFINEINAEIGFITTLKPGNKYAYITWGGNTNEFHLISSPDYEYTKGYQMGYNLGQAEGSYDASKAFRDGYEAGSKLAEGLLESEYLRGLQNGFESGYNDGYNYGYNNGFNNAYDKIITNDEYTLGYNDGFKDGEKSKLAQNNESFYNGIEKWLVPAIITVIVLGGIVSITAIKRREQ